MVLYAWTEPLPVSVSSKPKRRSVDLVLNVRPSYWLGSTERNEPLAWSDNDGTNK